MKANEIFIKAIKDKGLNAFLVIDRKEKNTDGEYERKQYMRLCIDLKNPYDVYRRDTTFVETPASIRYEDYTDGTKIKDMDSLSVVFHDSIYHHNDCHIKTFLNDIKKDSEIYFLVRINNNSDMNRKLNITCHQLFGYIGKRCYFLESYTGQQNLGSPIQY